MSSPRLSIALAQLNPHVGDISHNLSLIRDAWVKGADADVVVCPELVLVGYPPEDLVQRPAFVRAAREAADALVRESGQGRPALLVSLPWTEGGALYNAAAFITDGTMTLRFKHDLPNYGVFDEKRVFEPAPVPEPVPFRDLRLGILICEDMWTPAATAALAPRRIDFLLVTNGSPFEAGKYSTRLDLARARAAEAGCPLIYVNQVGGQDELVFDGGSFAIDADGRVRCRLPLWVAETAMTRWARRGETWTCVEGPVASLPDEEEAIYGALMTGLGDYVGKNRFRGVVIGLSGGVDSALSAVVAVDALGAAEVLGVRLPSRYTSQMSMDEAAGIAARLGIRLETFPIGEPVAAAESVLAPAFANLSADTTEENLQARVRGLLLMALSNKFGHLLLTTGNKSEVSVGYATLYGDMCGGYSVLKDLYKTEVYRLARWRNAHRPAAAKGPGHEVIPPDTLSRPPTAELRPNQTDQDSLPPYETLDAILQGLIEEERSVEAIAAAGFPIELVARVQRLLYQAEYKRRQAPPGVKITRRSFGRDRRYPITNQFRDPLPAKPDP
jgi:NAD+ synthase